MWLLLIMFLVATPVLVMSKDAHELRERIKGKANLLECFIIIYNIAKSILI